MHDSKVRSRLKARLTKFAAELCGELPKPLAKFVAQMLFGIQSSQDVKLSNIGRALGEAIPLIRTENRLSRNLKHAELEAELTTKLVEMASARIQQGACATHQVATCSERRCSLVTLKSRRLRRSITRESNKSRSKRVRCGGSLRRDIPKSNGKVRTLQLPCVRDRVVQGALKLILEAVFEADFCPNSYGFRPRRSPHRALAEVRRSVLRRMSTIIDVDLSRYLDRTSYCPLIHEVVANRRG